MQLHSRRQKDKNLIVETAIAAAAASASASIDLEQVQGGLIEGLQLELIHPAFTITSGKLASYVLQDSADNVTFADVDPKVSTATAAITTTSIAKTVEFPIPPVTRRYIRVNQATADMGGAGTAKFTIALLF